MYCLLCHEKIARLRAWRTKSEFCCDEHAEMYKRQTLERLMVDEEGKQARPLPSTELEPEPGTATAAEVEPATSAASELRGAASSPEGDVPGELDDPDGLDDLWTMADSVEEGPEAPAPEAIAAPEESTEDGPIGQEAQEALAALRALSGGAVYGTPEADAEDEYSALLEDSGLPDEPDSLPGLDDEDPLEALRLSWASDENPEPPGVEAEEDLFESAEDDDSEAGLPSILERLMEEPREAGQDSAPAVIAAEAKADEAEAPFDDLLDLVDDGVAALNEELAIASAEAESPAEATAAPVAEATEPVPAEEPARSSADEQIAEASERKSSKAPEETPAKVVPFPAREEGAPPPPAQSPAVDEKPAAAAVQAAAAPKPEPKPAAKRKTKRIPLRPAMVMAAVEAQPFWLDSVAGDEWERAALHAAWGKDAAPSPLRNGAARAIPSAGELAADRSPCSLQGALQARFQAAAVAARPAEITLVDAAPQPPLELCKPAWPIEWPKNWHEPPAAEKESTRLKASDDVVAIEPSTDLSAVGDDLGSVLDAATQAHAPATLFYDAPSLEQTGSSAPDSDDLAADWDSAAEENFGDLI